MAQEIEIEFKNLLTKIEYERLLHALPFPKQGVKQVNYYFETNDFLLKKHLCALRIREKDGMFRLTLKEPHQDGLLETHDILTEREAKNWLNGNIIPKKHTTKRLLRMGIDPYNLVYFGSLITERREFSEKDILYVLDYSVYNGQSDYELEIEATSKSKGLTQFHILLKNFQIEKRNTPNKIERFFSTRQN